MKALQDNWEQNPAKDVDTDDLIKDVEEFKDKEEENDNLRSKMQIL